MTLQEAIAWLENCEAQSYAVDVEGWTGGGQSGYRCVLVSQPDTDAQQIINSWYGNLADCNARAATLRALFEC